MQIEKMADLHIGKLCLFQKIMIQILTNTNNVDNEKFREF